MRQARAVSSLLKLPVPVIPGASASLAQLALLAANVCSPAQSRRGL